MKPKQQRSIEFENRLTVVEEKSSLWKCHKNDTKRSKKEMPTDSK